MMLLAPVSPVGFVAFAAPPGLSTTAASPDEYRIGISDQLRISVWREEDVSLPVIVRPDGKITVPLVGDVQAAGRTATDITRQIAQALTKYIKEPIVTVIVEEINSNTVYVIGEVNRQGAIELRQRTRFLQALAMAGGLTEFADKSRIVLLREVDGREVVRELDFKRLIRGEAPEENVYLRPEIRSLFTRTPASNGFRVLRLAILVLVVGALAPHSARAASNLKFLPSLEAFFFHDGNVRVTGADATSDQVARLQANLDLESRSPTTTWEFGYSIYRENFADNSELDNTGMWLATRYRKDTSRRNNYDLSFFAVRTERQRIRQETIEDPDTDVQRTQLDRLRFVARGRVETGTRSFMRWTGAGRINHYDGDNFTDSDSLDLGVGWGYEVSRKADLGVVYGYTRMEFEHSGAPPASGDPPPPTTNTHLLDVAFDYELGPKTEMRAFAGVQAYDEDGGESGTAPSFDFRVRREVTRGSDLIFGVRQTISQGTGRGGATQDAAGTSAGTTARRAATGSSSIQRIGIARAWARPRGRAPRDSGHCRGSNGRPASTSPSACSTSTRTRTR